MKRTEETPPGAWTVEVTLSCRVTSEDLHTYNTGAPTAVMDAWMDSGWRDCNPTYTVTPEKLTDEERARLGLSVAWDRLSDCLEDEDAGNDEVRDAAITLCGALEVARAAGLIPVKP